MKIDDRPLVPIAHDTELDDEKYAPDRTYKTFPFNLLPFFVYLKSSKHCPENRLQSVTDPAILAQVPNATYIGECGSIRTLIDKKPTIVENVAFWEPLPAARGFVAAQDALSKMGKDLKLVDMNSAGRLLEQQEAIRRARSATVFAHGKSAHQGPGAIDIHESSYDDPATVRLLKDYGYVHGNAYGSGHGRHREPVGTPIPGDPAHFSFREDLMNEHHPELSLHTPSEKHKPEETKVIKAHHAHDDDAPRRYHRKHHHR